ncbi:hypothetical protein [Pelagibius marinus]|uniref:hypothetical protein n=1 Tax=Pelagibius marinus TaxID=2762760 RepID=UPI001D049BC3|nr:hypothetical protein [Pelagibius marinus]
MGPDRFLTAVSDAARQREAEKAKAILRLRIGDQDIRGPDESICALIAIYFRRKGPDKYPVVAGAAMNDGTVATERPDRIVTCATVDLQTRIFVYVDRRISKQNVIAVTAIGTSVASLANQIITATATYVLLACREIEKEIAVGRTDDFSIKILKLNCTARTILCLDRSKSNCTYVDFHRLGGAGYINRVMWEDVLATTCIDYEIHVICDYTGYN